MGENITGKRLKLLRSQKGWTQAEVAKKIDISQQQYAGYESGSFILRADRLMSFAALYGVTADFLLGINGEGREERRERMEDMRSHAVNSIERAVAAFSGAKTPVAKTENAAIGYGKVMAYYGLGLIDEPIFNQFRKLFGY